MFASRLYSRLPSSNLTIAARLYSNEVTKKTALYSLHVSKGAKMVPFCGWDMPLVYEDLGFVASHLHTRSKASLFDVSHMLQTRITGKNAIDFIESLTVADVRNAKEYAAQLSVFTNEQGGIRDDTVITRLPNGDLYVVSNAGCSDKISALLKSAEQSAKGKGWDVNVRFLSEKSLVALQGPSAVAVVENLSGKKFDSLPFMNATPIKILGFDVHATRCGYTGEDGFELSVDSTNAVQLTEALLKFPDVKFAGLGARDSLRLEAGLCLYGNDIDETTSPVEAALSWTIGKSRRETGGFPGDSIILKQLKDGVSRRRVGLTVEEAPARQGARILSSSGQEIGKVTSGGPSPSTGKNVAIGYVDDASKKNGTPLKVEVRGKARPAVVVKTPFVESGYRKVSAK